jgi:hypothetical protein
MSLVRLVHFSITDSRRKDRDPIEGMAKPSGMLELLL